MSLMYTWQMFQEEVIVTHAVRKVLCFWMRDPGMICIPLKVVLYNIDVTAMCSMTKCK